MTRFGRGWAISSVKLTALTTVGTDQIQVMPAAMTWSCRVASRAASSMRHAAQMQVALRRVSCRP